MKVDGPSSSVTFDTPESFVYYDKHFFVASQTSIQMLSPTEGTTVVGTHDVGAVDGSSPRFKRITALQPHADSGDLWVGDTGVGIRRVCDVRTPPPILHRLRFIIFIIIIRLFPASLFREII